MKIMQEKVISAFVQAVVEIGCDIHAIDHLGYVFGDGDLTPAKQRAIVPQLRWIAETYGERDHLMDEIIAYLRSIGRYVEIEQQTGIPDGGNPIRLNRH
ncbi:hypothetical protein [Mesorhizobium japonicum]|uniref:Mll6261 protein n=1 Tax=Mesorhizobium japonicum (strain LMG 29417 / CECT 9101 / MAFF 303099) TaxID=266835 RepID=Q989W0_RHILO|nr:hypothetical protein [Mesorhizobium japonicum]BAB52584.1 mll6261 [Mesorhizobium japonicum MAFF 303099]